MGDADYANLLDLLRNSSDTATVVAAATALGARGEWDAVPDLVGQLRSDDQRVRKAAAVALGKIGALEAADALMALARADKSNRRIAIRSVLEVGGFNHLDEVIAVFESEGWLLNASEAKLLRRFADRRVVPLLVRSTESYAYGGKGIEPGTLKKVFGDVWARG